MRSMWSSVRKLWARSRVTSLTALMKRILPLRALRLCRAADDDAGLHRRVVEEVRPEAEDALDQVGFDELAPHLRLFLAEQHAVREEDGAAAGLGLEAAQDVLPEGVVGAALRRRAVEVAAPRVGRRRRRGPTA